jgi:hypothetical protein
VEILLRIGQLEQQMLRKKIIVNLLNSRIIIASLLSEIVSSSGCIGYIQQ